VTKSEQISGIIFAIPGIFYIFLFFLLATLFINHCFYGADLDDLYTPLLGRDNFFYQAEFDYFKLKDRGIHGDVVYDYENFKSSPYLFSLYNSLRVPALSFLDLQLGFKQTGPLDYTRYTFTSPGRLAVAQDYDLDYFQDYSLLLRARRENLEFYLQTLGKRQRTNWYSKVYIPPPSWASSYAQTYFLDITLGLRYLTPHKDNGRKLSLAQLIRPLLEDGQLNLEAQLGCRKGKLRADTHYYWFGLYRYRFFHDAGSHLIPQFTLRYGLNKDLEITSGLYYVTPLEYDYAFKLYTPAGTTRYIAGTYELKDNFCFPFRLRYRLRDCLEIMFSSDLNYVSQTLNYWRKELDNSRTVFPVRELTYLNSRPTLKLTFFYDNDKNMQEDDFSALTKNLLLKDQYKMELEFQRDITHLKKNQANGPQNIIDPYNVFLYPLDYFVGGTEYATFFTGNTINFATNVTVQNYYLIQAHLNYGLTDWLNLGLGAGFRSDSSLHHAALSDMESRFYKFDSYCFFDLICDWQTTKNSLFTLTFHFVPRYKILLEHHGYPQRFKSDNKYFQTSLAFKVLF